MKKIASLREYLVTWVPELKQDPARLLIHVESGRLAVRYGANLGWEYRYKVSLTVLNYTKHQDTFFLPLVVWLRNNIPDLFLSHDTGDQAIQFEVDIVDSQAVDIMVSVDLHESVDVLPRNDGSGAYDMSHRDEPPIEGLEGDEGLATLPDNVLLLISPYGEYFLSKQSDLYMPPA